MDALIALAAILIGLDIAALCWGADSRDTVADDHAR